MSGSSFRIEVVVAPEDIDELGHANNVNYLRWMLEAATAHWDRARSEAEPAAVAGVGWVVMRHELDYFLAAFVGESLEVLTWVPTCTALTCDRYYEITRLADGALLARGASTYCVVDLNSGKPRRLGEQLRVAIGSPELVKRLRTERSFPLRP
jgi:acyl-CoA thioester hydrolase